MQPISINTKIIEELVSNGTNSKVQREFHKLTENLEKFHNVYIDKSNDGSHWLNQFRRIRNNINDQNVKKLFDDLIGPRNIKYIPVNIHQTENYLFEITRQTPEKIGINNEEDPSRELQFYDLATFNSHDFDTQNFLFRIPKLVNVPPGCKFRDFRLLTPYLRQAEKIEVCDLFLFESARAFQNELDFIFELLSLCKNKLKLKIHCKPNEVNISQKKFEKELKNKFNKIEFEGFFTYNPPSKDVNHDRFIIINSHEFSIRFTTSFNNLRKNDGGTFEAKDSFLIEFSRGRKYYDQ